MASQWKNSNGKFPEGKYIDHVNSEQAGWRSLGVRIREQPPCDEPIRNPGFSDHAVSLLLSKSIKVESFYKGKWRGLRQYFKGMGSLTPAGHECVVRRHFEGQSSLASLVLILHQDSVDSVAQELSRPGFTCKTVLNEVPFLDDPFVTNLSSSVVSALKAGAPDFYAQAAAQWLAAHLLLGSSRGIEWHKSLARERISDYRLVRVLEYIDAHLSDRLDLRALSREAGISQFHFAALFRKAVGASPHRHILQLRLQTARSMLCHTDKSILEIALSCGFGTESHFAAAFRREFSQSPMNFRSSQRAHSGFGEM
ncbi:AraC family transcriptional regulator [Terriglobus roseus]|uniref:AraC family transcriptional regulator n=1 Tax=Terriglobus roseus TaxID=392734 RepID=A0A1H4SFL1_9BACT|nr:AraC family transcriptional regulator [Terriglobus roseus]SEC42883.1 AraC family transcriptional regulator [Terriglobus roseus]